MAIVKGTKSAEVIKVLKQIPSDKRSLVKEITLDMAGSMNLIAETCFVKAIRVTDRFHVQKLAFDALQDVRIQYRWLALEEENKGVSKIFSNGDTSKQLLARSRYLLFKPSSKWTVSQFQRAQILFQEYPEIKQAYDLVMELTSIYEHTKIKGVAFTKMAQWFDKVDKSGFDSFKTVKRSFQTHYQAILNYFDSRSTNASAESFNAKIKEFRRTFRGVRDVKFFLFRVSKIFA